MNAPVQRIDEILSMSYSVDEFMGVELPPNDDDSWMYDGEEELNSAILERQKEMEVYESEKKQMKQKKGIENASSSVSDDFNPQDITETMQAFVQKLSSFEGAEVPESRFVLGNIKFLFRCNYLAILCQTVINIVPSIFSLCLDQINLYSGEPLFRVSEPKCL